MSMTNGVYVSGQWQSGAGDLLRSTDPASGETFWEGTIADAAQVEAAIGAARKAFRSWALTPVAERIAILEAFEKVLERRASEVSETISREVGKALWETNGEVGAMRGKVGLSVRAQAERAGERVDETAFGRAQLTHRPHGVMAVFGPFNFPGHLPNGHIVPALLAGNTVVFKPSEFAPATGELLVRCLEEAGVPAGVVNLVQGGRSVGGALLDGDIDGVLFTGSARAGTYMHEKFAGRTDVILALEMGGNNPLIVWDAADVEAAADIAAQSAFLTTGQRCSCARRLVLPEGAFGDQVIDAIKARIEGLSIGAWDTPDIFMGPLVHGGAAKAAFDFEAHLTGLGGHPIVPLSGLELGDAFVRPGLIDMTSAREGHDEELFGPFLQVYRVKHFDDALERANATRFGLAGGLISEDPDLWTKAHALMRAGILNLNRPTAGASSAMPFGGPGLSGNHRPSAWYAADYCAWPQASQIADKADRLSAPGFPS